MSLYQKKEFSLEMGSQKITVETGRLAKQADGAVLVSSEGTQVLVTVCSAKTVKDGQDFFPLTVDYTEKFYAAGKFLGGYMKREARPSTSETLNARLIDRPLRPLFPEGYMFDTFVQATVLSYSPKADPEVLAALGASAALAVSDIPFAGPLGTCKVGKIDGKLVVNPAHDQWENSELELVVAATKDAIMMVEGEGQIISEADMQEAIEFAHDSIIPFCELIETMTKEIGREKREFVSSEPNKTATEKVYEVVKSDVETILNIVPKLERQNAVRALNDKVSAELESNYSNYGFEESTAFSKEAYKIVDEILYNKMREAILAEGKRIGGRKTNEVREIETEVDILSVPHGSSLFTRGETQVLATTTLGGAEGEQSVDSIRGYHSDKFYLHYAFPPFSVGEARGVRGVGRRELGHGNLAERAVKAVLPKNKFPYTMRVMCEVLESNGSSSMGSVCSASMALMDAGVPLVNPVAGIAMGLIKEGENYQILTDILGDEDHLGDMDFKVAGTEDGITAIQMDIKIKGITREILSKALAQAKEGRIHILEEMSKTISTARTTLKGQTPKIETLQIDPDKIGLLIGPGGKNIKALQKDFEVTIEVTEDGEVKFFATDSEKIAQAKSVVELQIVGPKKDDVFDGKAVTIKDYGAFIDLAPGVSGLLHVSEIAEERVKEVTDYISEGDTVKVKVLEVDKFGKLKLSAKAIEPLKKKE